MLTLLLCCAVAQYDTPKWHEADADLAIQQACEDFARAEPPAHWAAIFRGMAASSWKDRDEASKRAIAMAQAHPEEQRWLMVGRRHRDPEVGIRCNAVLKKLHPCGACKGLGYSNNWNEWPCWECGSRKTEWPFDPWD